VARRQTAPGPASHIAGLRIEVSVRLERAGAAARPAGAARLRAGGWGVSCGMVLVAWCLDLGSQATARSTSQHASLMMSCTQGAWRSVQGKERCTGPNSLQCARQGQQRRAGAAATAHVAGAAAARPGAHLSTAVTPAAGKRHSTCQRSRRSRRLKQLLLRARRSMPGCCRCRATPRARACARRAGPSARGRRRGRAGKAALRPRGARRCARQGRRWPPHSSGKDV